MAAWITCDSAGYFGRGGAGKGGRWEWGGGREGMGAEDLEHNK